MTSVKICGLHPSDDTSFTKADVVTHVGIIFVSQSRRYVTPADARKITTSVAAGCQVMGVFANQSVEQVYETLRTSGCQGAQLHGEETPDECEELRSAGFVTWKALSIPTSSPDSSELTALMVCEARKYARSVDALLLDAKPKGHAPKNVTGGHGESFEWSVLPRFLEEWRLLTDIPVWIAGGLRPDNVHSLFELCNPDGIDVSSGVEEHGRKSPRLIHDLIEKVETRERNELRSESL